MQLVDRPEIDTETDSHRWFFSASFSEQVSSLTTRPAKYAGQAARLSLVLSRAHLSWRSGQGGAGTCAPYALPLGQAPYALPLGQAGPIRFAPGAPEEHRGKQALSASLLGQARGVVWQLKAQALAEIESFNVAILV